jgi:hypothetical protein
VTSSWRPGVDAGLGVVPVPTGALTGEGLSVGFDGGDAVSSEYVADDDFTAADSSC